MKVENFSTRLNQEDIKELAKWTPKRVTRDSAAVRNPRELPEKLETLFVFRTVPVDKPSRKQREDVQASIKEIRGKKNRSEMEAHLSWIFWNGRIGVKPDDWVVENRGRSVRSPLMIRI